MNKLFTKIATLGVGLAMAIGVGVAVGAKDNKVEPADAYGTVIGTYEITAASTVSKSQGAPGTATWNGPAKTTALSNGKTFSISGLSGYTITDVTVSMRCSSNNKSAATLTWKFDSESGTAVAYSKSAGTLTSTFAARDLFTGLSKTGSTFSFTTSNTGSSAYLENVVLYGSASKSVSSLTVLDENAESISDGDTINVAASNNVATADVTCEVSYSTGSPDGAVAITSEPSTGFSVDTDDNSTYTMTFVANGDYDVTIASTVDSKVKIVVTYHVTGIVAVVYERVTSASQLKSGLKFLIANTDGTYVMKPFVSGNNCPYVASSLNAQGKMPVENIGTGYALLTLGGSSGAWTITDENGNSYLGYSGQNYLRADTTTNDTWTIEIDSTNYEATITSAASGRWIAQNTSTYAFATYANSNQWEVAMYMLPSTDPAIEVAVTGSTSLSVGGTATLTASKVNGATGTVTWSKSNNHVTLSATTGDSITVTGATDGSTDVTASLTGGSTVDPVVTTFTVTRALSSIAVTTAPTKTTYTEGESFDNTGMVVTATYDDESTETPNDYTWSPDGALTPSDTSITISWGGKSTTQAITVNAKTVDHIKVKTLPTKNAYHSGDEFDSTGLVITVCYNAGETDTADITSGFTLSPASYTFDSDDEEEGSKTFTVTYSGKEVTFDVTVKAITGPLGNGGRYYIMSSDKAYGLNAVASGSSPSAVDLSSSNELTAFDFELVAENEYKVTVTIDETLYYLACTTTAASGSNSSIRINTTSTTATWHLDSEGVETEGAYHFYTVPGSVERYLSCYNSTDWRGYVSLSYGDPEIQFVAEGSYANAIADSLNNDLTCDNGEHAPSTSVWSSISSAYGNVTIAHERNLLKNAEYTKSGSGDDTVVVAQGTTTQDIAEAVAKYDYIVGLYNKGRGITAYNDFLKRDPATIAGSNIIGILGDASTSNATLIIIVISLVSLTAVGGYFLLKKKKEQ